jgi:DNA-binding NtrC family response regulator
LLAEPALDRQGQSKHMLEARTEPLHLQVTDTTLQVTDTTVSIPPPALPCGLAPPGRLSVVFPRSLAAAFAVAEHPFVLGRQGDARLLHPTVSRTHAAIAWSPEAGAHLVRDLDSHNGSMLDGAPLGRRPRPLRDGSVLRLGSVLAVWEHLPAVDDPDGPEPAAGAVDRDAIPGQAARVRTLRAAIARAACDRAPVLILGETGSGKERVARELHRLSGRTGALIAIHCAVLQPSQIEGELFGRGGLSGAHQAPRGLFREARGGTLFLDEISELPGALQARLLRAIEDQDIAPPGDPTADVRVVAATHRRPADAIAAGLLREDLYARLSLWELHVPPLRARRVDFPDWLARMHAARSGPAARHPLPPLSTDAMETLLLQRWPLNLRAVERLVRDLATRPPDLPINPCDLPAWLQAAALEVAAAQLAGALDTTLDASGDVQLAPAARSRPPVPSRDEFIAAFEQLGGSVRALARHFARDRRQIYRWIDTHGIADRR